MSARCSLGAPSRQQNVRVRCLQKALCESIAVNSRGNEKHESGSNGRRGFRKAASFLVRFNATALDRSFKGSPPSLHFSVALGESDHKRSVRHRGV